MSLPPPAQPARARAVNAPASQWDRSMGVSSASGSRLDRTPFCALWRRRQHGRRVAAAAGWGWSLNANSAHDWRRQKRPQRMQHFLKPLVGAAGARVVAAELFEQFLVAVDDADAALDVRLGGVAAAALAGALK